MRRLKRLGKLVSKSLLLLVFASVMGGALVGLLAAWRIEVGLAVAVMASGLLMALMLVIEQRNRRASHSTLRQLVHRDGMARLREMSAALQATADAERVRADKSEQQHRADTDLRRRYEESSTQRETAALALLEQHNRTLTALTCRAFAEEAARGVSVERSRRAR